MSPRAVRRLLATATCLTLVTGASVVGLRTLNASEPLTVDEAVERFRGSRPPSATRSTAPGRSATPSATATVGTAAPRSSAPTTPGPTVSGPARRPAARGTQPPSDRRPAEGVYVYATSGYEELHAGTSSRHDYPAETTITVRHEAGCRLVGRWDGTQDRWDETHECFAKDSSTITKYVSFHRFFGQDERKELTCGPRSYLRPPSTRPGYTWTFTCTGSGTTAHTTGRIVGVEQTAHGRALHVRATTTLGGSSRGNERRDYWLSLEFPGMVRADVLVDATESTPFGSVRYHEEYQLQLTSRTPRR